MSPPPKKKAKKRQRRGVPSAASGSTEGVQLIPVDQLRLDPENPRLAEYGLDSGANQSALLQGLWSKMAVEEVALSIAHNGYFPHEPLLVQKSGSNFVVLEGNRRLAAVRLLIDEDLRQKLKATNLPDIDTIDERRRQELQTLPCVVTTREAVWRYLGFKHVNGPATWGSYAKAQYIARVHNEYRVPLADIAQQIGDMHSTVERLYRGLMVVEQAEAEGVFDRTNSFGKFGFSHIYTGLDKPGIQKFLGIEKKKRDVRRPVPKSKIKNLGELCLWLYGDASQERAPVMRSQNPDLRILDAVLLDPDGVRSLRDGLSLKLAHNAALGDDRLFRGALQDSKQSLQQAHATLSTGFDPKDGDSFRLATEVEDLAIDLLQEMHSKKARGKRRASKRAK